MKPKAVIVGAGALGLGFLAERLVDDYDLCLADVQSKSDVLRLIEKQQGFRVNVCRLDGIYKQDVTGAFNIASADGPDAASFDRALQESDLVLTATGVESLDSVVSRISTPRNASAKRAWLLFCENGRHAATYAPRFGDKTVLVDTVMSRMCRFGDPVETGYEPLGPKSTDSLVVEDHDFLPLDVGLCSSGPFGPAFSLVPHAEYACWEDVKMFLHNGMHAFVSYRAYLEGARLFVDTPDWIRQKARQVMLDEVIPAIVHTHPVANRAELEHYGFGLLDRFFNPWFRDTIERGVRGVEEKLVPGARLRAGCEYIRRAGIEPRGFYGTVEAAMEILARQRIEALDGKQETERGDR